MTTLVDAPAPADAESPRRRRIWLWASIGLVVTAIAATAITAVVYAHTYQPLAPGNYAYGPLGDMHPVSDGVVDPTRFIMTGPAGSVGVIDYSIQNNGSHDVTILGSNPSDSFIRQRLSWSPPEAGGDLNPLSGHTLWKTSRRFPATLKPSQELTMWVTVTKPGCSPGQGSESDEISLRTYALHVHHVWNLMLTGLPAFTAPYDVCSPATALKHIVSE